jgi:muramoyltetrapeptide carboxypeptidase LdcA involved in peptidoglycan recycling
MKVWDLIKPIWGWVVAALVVVSLYSYYTHLNKKAERAEILSQELAVEVKIEKEQADAFKKLAEEKDAKAKDLEQVVLKAEQKVVVEHAKSEALKKRLANLLPHGPVVPLPGVPSDDPVLLRDQIIAQQDEEILSLNTVVSEQKVAMSNLTSSRDAWKNTYESTATALEASEKRVMAEQIAKDAMKHQGWMREGKGALEGGAIVALAHILGVF